MRRSMGRRLIDKFQVKFRFFCWFILRFFLFVAGLLPKIHAERIGCSQPRITGKFRSRNQTIRNLFDSDRKKRRKKSPQNLKCPKMERIWPEMVDRRRSTERRPTIRDRMVYEERERSTKVLRNRLQDFLKCLIRGWPQKILIANLRVSNTNATKIKKNSTEQH